MQVALIRAANGYGATGTEANGYGRPGTRRAKGQPAAATRLRPGAEQQFNGREGTGQYEGPVRSEGKAGRPVTTGTASKQ